ncbi:MAG: MgtC/SapB family protein [Bacteroidetes bacterium]|nr:MgtC/SapB family protein [Bacteroidota bacterium]
MDWGTESTLIVRTLIASGLGALIGLERQLKGKDAGVRTYAAVALGACTFALVGVHVGGQTIDTRIAANIVVGVGFLGAGMIIKQSDRIAGLTTAATVWATAAMGMSIAYGMYVLGALTALIIGGLLLLRDKLPKGKPPTDEGA